VVVVEEATIKPSLASKVKFKGCLYLLLNHGSHKKLVQRLAFGKPGGDEVVGT
jgi:hypothetical protein